MNAGWRGLEGVYDPEAQVVTVEACVLKERVGGGLAPEVHALSV